MRLAHPDLAAKTCVTFGLEYHMACLKCAELNHQTCSGYNDPVLLFTWPTNQLSLITKNYSANCHWHGTALQAAPCLYWVLCRACQLLQNKMKTNRYASEVYWLLQPYCLKWVVNNATFPPSDWTHNKDKNNNHLMWCFLMLKCSLRATMFLAGTVIANDVIVSGLGMCQQLVGMTLWQLTFNL